MSGQYSQQRKKQPRGGNSSNYGALRARPTKNQQDKSVLNDGIYKNESFMHTIVSLIGCPFRVRVNNGRVYEGILRTCSPQLEVVLEKVHLVEGAKLPSKENILQSMIFAWRDVVNMNATDIDLEYAFIGSDGFTDASISSRFNGRTNERELQPWMNPEDCLDLESGSLEDSNANGWDANSMFEANESKFNYKSKYDPSLREYTTELHKADTEEYRSREAEAERQAKEILSSSTHSENMDLENGDEEMAFSAVHRTEEVAPPAPAAGNGGKYVVPQHRNAQSGVPPAQRPQQLVVPPSAQTTDAGRGQHHQTILPSGVETVPAAVVSASPGMIRLNAGDVRKEEMERPPASVAKATLPPAIFETLPEKAKVTVANVSASVKPDPQRPRSDAIQELREFRQNFKLPDAAEPKEMKHSTSQQLQQQPPVPQSAVPVPSTTPIVAPAQPQMQPAPPPVVASQQTAMEHGRHGYEEREEAKEDTKEDLSKKFVLNPSAKEFVPAIKMYSATRNLPSQTPPRPPSTVGSPVYVPIVSPAVYQATIVAPPANVQQQRNNTVPNKRASVSVSARPEINPPPQAMTGAPLITQQVMIPGPAMLPGGLTMMSVHQPVLRMIPQHTQNVMIDPSQPVFVPVASPLTSHQPPAGALGPGGHHVITGGPMPGTMHNPHGAAGMAVGPPQQTSGAPTPTPMHQYGQAGSSMSLPTTSGTPQPPAQIQLYPGGPGGPTLAISHTQPMHPSPLQHISNNPTSPIIYQGPGMIPFTPQFPHQGPGMAYAISTPGQQSAAMGHTQVGAGQQPMGMPHQPPPPAMGQSSHVLMHGPHQMVMAPQPHSAYMGMPVPAGMTQAGIAQHPVTAFHTYNMPGPGPTFTINP